LRPRQATSEVIFTFTRALNIIIRSFGHAFHFETDTGRQGVFGSKANDWNVKFDREALVGETLYHAPDADGLDIK
jgi:hypothetical protein